MALKVLLADESSTIKKVFQLALQDYAVEVRSVNVGLDVIQVAESFQPDIIFADVLLQKRSGYDVSADVKTNPNLQNTPVVIMWSGFMELDQDKFAASSANGQLEKPFDVDGLRQVIHGLVSKAKTQNLAEFLDFPNMPEFSNTPQEPATTESSVNSMLNLPKNTSEPKTEPESWDMESFDSIENVTASLQPEASITPEEDFTQINLPPSPKVEPPKESMTPHEFLAEEDDDEDSSWIQKDISKYKVDADPDLNAEEQPLSIKYVVPEETIEPSTIATTDQPDPMREAKTFIGTEALPIEEDENDLELDIEDVPTPAASAVPIRLSEERIEEIIRAQSEEMIEKVIWKVVPDLASRIIERELDRLLSDRGL